MQNSMPYVMVMLNNGYLSLIRQPSKYIYEMDYAVNIGYGAEGYGPDFVKLIESFGGAGRRVTRPDDIKAALAWAVETSNSRKLPVLVEIRIDRQTDAAMGTSIDKIVERDPVVDLPEGTPVGSREKVGTGAKKK